MNPGHRNTLLFFSFPGVETYPSASTGDFEQSETFGHSTLFVELRQRERHSLLDVIVIRAQNIGTVGTQPVHPD